MFATDLEEKQAMRRNMSKSRHDWVNEERDVEIQ